jgi:hypothetical protein
VRFSFATTLAPQWEYMNASSVVDKGKTSDYYRFYMKDGLLWENVVEMANYGVGMAFHNVKDENAIAEHYSIAQGIVLEKLAGRGVKFLAEPDGNKAYITVAQGYSPIQTITAQNGGGGVAVEPLYPFKVESDLNKTTVQRVFYETPAILEDEIARQLALPVRERKAIMVGVHGTDEGWVQFFQWLNDTFGKDGDDSVWVPSQEEYYEYNYYRRHADIEKIVEGNTLKITVSLPSGQYFHYPSVTVNLKGLSDDNVTDVSSSNSVTGLSRADHADGMMLNLDCRKALAAHATHFVEEYEKQKSASNRRDALYFVNMLKESQAKRGLLDRVE